MNLDLYTIKMDGGLLSPIVEFLRKKKEWNSFEKKMISS